MEDFFKEYKGKSNKEILEIMSVLKGEFDKTKEVLVELTLYIEDVEKKFNLLNNEIKTRKTNV